METKSIFPMMHEMGLSHSDRIGDVKLCFNCFFEVRLRVGHVLVNLIHLRGNQWEPFREDLMLIVVLSPKLFLLLLEFGEFRNRVLVICFVVHRTHRFYLIDFEDLHIQIFVITDYLLKQKLLGDANLFVDKHLCFNLIIFINLSINQNQNVSM